MQKKTLGILTAAAIALGTAGFATSASAATPAAGLTTPVATKTADANVQTVHHYYRDSHFYRRCNRLRFKGWTQRRRWARRAYRNEGCGNRYYHRRYYPYYYGPRFRIQLGF